AARSMSLHWTNFWFGALDPAGSVTVDKLPGALWLQALLVRAFGFHDRVLLLPGAVAAALSVPLLFVAVRRWAGTRAGFIAAVALLVTPIVFATAQVGLPDPVLMLTLVAAAYAITRAVHGSSWWLVAAAALIGYAF